MRVNQKKKRRLSELITFSNTSLLLCFMYFMLIVNLTRFCLRYARNNNKKNRVSLLKLFIRLCTFGLLWRHILISFTSYPCHSLYSMMIVLVVKFLFYIYFPLLSQDTYIFKYKKIKTLRKTLINLEINTQFFKKNFYP